MPQTSPSTETEFNWRYLLNIAGKHRQKLVLAHLIAIMATLLMVPVPMLMPFLVDEVLLEKPGMLVTMMNGIFPQSWTGSAFYIVTIMLFSLLLRFGGTLLAVWQTREFTLIAKDITFKMRKLLLRRLATISMAEYETLGSGSFSSHLVTDIDSIDQFLGTALSKFLVAVLTIIGVAFVLMWIHWQLALFVMIMNPIVIYFTTVLGKKVKHLKSRENKAVEIFQQSLTETLDAIQQIRAANRERHYILQVIDHAKGVRQTSASFSWKSDAANRISFFIFLMGFEFFRAASMLMVLFSSLSIGEMFAVYAYLWFMMTPVQEILNIQYNLYSANAAMSRLNQLLRLNREPVYKHRKNPFANQKTVSIQMRDVHFAYGHGEPVLSGVNIDIQAGEKIALVGASGGGKSTMVQVLLGLYTPDRGQVFFDNVPVTDIGLEIVRENVATVLQQPALFNDSIRNNLQMGRPCSDEQLWQALEIAQLQDVIELLDQGLDSIVGRNGIKLSGGQRQRLAIARLILTDPSVVILDEATSALDTTTEDRLHVALQNFLKGKTTIIIAHRLSAVKQANRAYVFDNGQIIDQGHHDDLVNRDGLYQELYGQRQTV